MREGEHNHEYNIKLANKERPVVQESNEAILMTIIRLGQ